MPEYRCPICQKPYKKPGWVLKHLYKNYPEKLFIKRTGKIEELDFIPLRLYFDSELTKTKKSDTFLPIEANSGTED
ncbi:MAG: hypothetical protein ACXAEU_07140 [Candidatus Hodarchaeales archaeon]|jgi:hypothetical protein